MLTRQSWQRAPSTIRAYSKTHQETPSSPYIGRAGTALQQLGALALLDIERTLANIETGRVVKRKSIEILQEIDSEQTIDILLQHIDIPDPELRHHVYMALASVQYQASDDDHYKFVNTLTEEVESVTYLLASMEDLWSVDGMETLHSALGHELDLHATTCCC